MASDLKPLVTVITGTYRRAKTVTHRTVPVIESQTYKNLEHIVISDGEDPSLDESLLEIGYSYDPSSMRRLYRLGRNWTQPFANGSNAAICRLVGTYLARGEIIGVLDDDNVWDERHVEDMVNVFQATNVEMVCSHFNSPGGLLGWHEPPRLGNVDTSSFMIRWEALKRSNWMADGYTCDGSFVERLIAAGCTYAIKPGATVTLPAQRMGAPD